MKNLLPRDSHFHQLCQEFPGLLFDIAKIQHLKKALSVFDRLGHKKHCFLTINVHFLWRILIGWGKVDAVVLTDVTYNVWREFLSLGRDTKGFKDRTTRCKIASECSG